MNTEQTGIGHPHIDARALDTAKLIAERIDNDPALFHVGRRNLDRWRRLHGELSRARREWEGLLTLPWPELRALLLEESDEGQRLRSSHPFAGIVTDAERLAIMDRHPPPWPHVRWDPTVIDPAVMARILSEGQEYR